MSDVDAVRVSASRAPWQRPSGLGAVLDGWREDSRVQKSVVLDAVVPERPASHVPYPQELAPSLRSALVGRGIEQLFTHQARAYELGRARRDFVIATPTASGKSLCYNLPVLDALARQRDGRALYMFPTKALSRDQEEALRALMRDAALEHGAITYDGDTPGDARRAARERSGILLTNPDMLHSGILPHHATWARLFSNLAYVVVDELHTYRGVFGSHLANVLRRLERIARFYGASPSFIFASATIGNPAEHASRMLGRPVELVSESGAPSGERHVLVYNPPVVNSELGIRQSYVKAAVRLAADLVRAQVPTIVFGQSRNTVEVMLKYLRDRLAEDGIPPESVVAYRGGYLPETRRSAEADLRAGRIRCVVATSALELGIDIGMLDAVVCAGYPGSIASLWQRFGRSGRRGEPSLALLVTSSAPLDQFFAAEPDSLIGAPIEQARIDPDNVEILVQHMKCAAFELPFEEGERFGDLPPEGVKEMLGFLAQHGVVHPVAGKAGRSVYHWSADTYPATQVSLRSVGWDNVVIIDAQSSTTIAEMDWRSSHTMLHEQAIYQHAGEQYQVERFDHENHKAYVRKIEPDYYTTAMTNTAVTVIDTAEQGATAGNVACGLGEVSVVETVVGFKKIKFHTHENTGYGEVRLPEMQMHTTAAWLTVPEEALAATGAPRPELIDALHGIANALHTVATVSLMIDPRDLGRTVGNSGGDTAPAAGRGAAADAHSDPTIFLFDHFPGGVGLAPRIFDDRAAMLARARRLIDACACACGCPACVGPVAGDGAKDGGRKALAGRLLDAMGVAAS